MTDGGLRTGSIVRFAYLWAHERDAGRQEGLKPRRRTAVATRFTDPGGRAWIALLPLTTREPGPDRVAYELSEFEVRRVGSASADRLWVICDELNMVAADSDRLDPDGKVGDLTLPSIRAIAKLFAASLPSAKAVKRDG